MNQSEITIERIGPQHLERVRKMANTRLRERYTEELFDHFYENFRGCFLVASSGDEIKGFLLAVPKDGSSLRVLMLAVDKEAERSGVGSMLMEVAEGYAATRRMKEISLEVGTINTTGVGFYCKLGFKIVGVLKEYYRDRSDAFIMRKLIPS